MKVPAITAAWPKQELNASKIKEECGQIEIYGKSRKLCCYDMVLSILGRHTQSSRLRIDVHKWFGLLNPRHYFGCSIQEVLYGKVKLTVLRSEV